jgi:hypothetical protein
VARLGRVAAGGLLLVPVGPQRLKHSGQKRQDDYCGDYQMDAALYVGDFSAQRITPHDHAANPQESAEDVKNQISRIAHLRSPGDGRAEGPHNGNKARDDDGLWAVLFVELVRALQVLLLEKARILAAVQTLPRFAADEIAQLVACYGAQARWHEEPGKPDLARSRKHPRRHQKGISGEKKPHEEARLDENYRAYHQRPARLYQVLDVIDFVEPIVPGNAQEIGDHEYPSGDDIRASLAIKTCQRPQCSTNITEKRDLRRRRLDGRFIVLCSYPKESPVPFAGMRPALTLALPHKTVPGRKAHGR